MLIFIILELLCLEYPGVFHFTSPISVLRNRLKARGILYMADIKMKFTKRYDLRVLLY